MIIIIMISLILFAITFRVVQYEDMGYPTEDAISIFKKDFVTAFIFSLMYLFLLSTGKSVYLVLYISIYPVCVIAKKVNEGNGSVFDFFSNYFLVYTSLLSGMAKLPILIFALVFGFKFKEKEEDFVRLFVLCMVTLVLAIFRKCFLPNDFPTDLLWIVFLQTAGNMLNELLTKLILTAVNQ